MNFNIWLAFILACFLFSSAPGVGILSTVNNAMTKSAKYTAFAIGGLEVALVFYLLLVAIGLGTIISKSQMIFNIIKWLGVVYLIWLGIQKFRSPVVNTGSLNIIKNQNYRKAFITGMCVNLSNPKSIIFLAALLPQFIKISEPQIKQYIILGVTMVLIDTLFHSIYGFFAKNLRHVIMNNTWSGPINRVFGLMFMGAGLLLAKSNR